MTARKRLPVLALAALVGAGCIQFPERDGRWLSMGGEPQETRVLYAEKMKRNGTIAGAIGTPIGSVGMVIYVIGLVGILSCDAADDVCLNNNLALALAGAVVGATGLGIGISGFQSRGKWAEVIASGASPHAPIIPGGPMLPPPPPVPGPSTQPAPAPVRPPEEPPRRPAGEDLALPDGRTAPALARLYLPSGEALPAGGDLCAVVRVSGPGDPVVARLAARVPVLRWPVLEERAPQGPGTVLAVGAEAVAEALGRPGRG